MPSCYYCLREVPRRPGLSLTLTSHVCRPPDALGATALDRDSRGRDRRYLLLVGAGAQLERGERMLDADTFLYCASIDVGERCRELAFLEDLDLPVSEEGLACSEMEGVAYGTPVRYA